MSFEFKLPDIGEGVVEGEIVEWLVKEGDVVKEDQPLVAVMTDKATVEIPSPRAGRILALGAPVGKTIKVGAVLVSLEPSGGAATAAPASAPAAKAPAPATPARPAAVVAAPTPPRPAPVTGPAPMPVAASAAGGAHVVASPATRKLARQLGVDLAAIAGTGPHGRVTSDDVEAASRAPRRGQLALAEAPLPARHLSPAPAPKALLAIPRHTAGPADRTEDRVPLRGLRKKIAERMAQSKRTAAHFAYVDECDVSALVRLRAQLKPEAARYGVSLTYLPFVMKALVPCLREFPLLNATLDESASELVLKKYYNLGVATDTDAGLTVPVVKDVDRKSILEIAAEIAELTERARTGRTRMEDIQGGTFTITSTGNIGGLFATPIINYPEVAILGVPKIRQRPWVVDGRIEIRDVIYLAISLDHRVVDGAVAARFLNRLIEILTDPAKLILELA